MAQHKVSIEKLLKLKRLGIDTIAISIPDSSPEDIEECFKHTERTKWIYNNENERQTIYNFPSHLREQNDKLMKSKEIFLETISTADARKLETLYTELSDAWNRNNIPRLKENLEASLILLAQSTASTRVSSGISQCVHHNLFKRLWKIQMKKDCTR